MTGVDLYGGRRAERSWVWTEDMEVGRWKSIGEEEGWGRVEFFNIYCGAHILIIN